MRQLRAASDPIGGVRGEQRQDVDTVPDRLSPTAASFGAGPDAWRGANTWGSIAQVDFDAAEGQFPGL